MIQMKTSNKVLLIVCFYVNFRCIHAIAQLVNSDWPANSLALPGPRKLSIVTRQCSVNLDRHKTGLNLRAFLMVPLETQYIHL